MYRGGSNQRGLLFITIIISLLVACQSHLPTIHSSSKAPLNQPELNNSQISHQLTAPPKGFTIPSESFTIPPRSLTITPKRFSFIQGTAIIPAVVNKDLFTIPPRSLTAPPKGFTIPPRSFQDKKPDLTIPPRGFEIASLKTIHVNQLRFELNGQPVAKDRILIKKVSENAQGDIEVSFVSNALPIQNHQILSLHSPSGLVVLGTYLEEVKPSQNLLITLESTALALMKGTPMGAYETNQNLINHRLFTPLLQALELALGLPKAVKSNLHHQQVQDLLNQFSQDTLKDDHQGNDNPSSSFEIEPSKLSISNIGVSELLRVNGLKRTNSSPTIVWSSQDPSIASVNQEGLVTANALGTTIISARSNSSEAVSVIEVLDDALKATPTSLPKILSSNSVVGSIGETIDLTVKDLYPGTAENSVYFDDINASILSINNDTIHVNVPQNINGIVEITVRTPRGSSNKLKFSILPKIISIDLPNAAVGQQIILNGNGFAPQTMSNSVAVNNIAANVNLATPTSLQITVPANSSQLAGAISVSTSGGSSTYNPYDIYPGVSTLTGNGTAGFIDGNSSIAQFNNPVRVIKDGAGNLLIADQNNHRIRRIDPVGNVTTIAGNGNAGFIDGPALTAEFNMPYGLAIDSAGNVYVADSQNLRIRKIDTGGMVTTIAGDGTAGLVNGPGATAQFRGTWDVALNSTETFLYVADAANHVIRQISTTPPFNVTTLAGNGASGFVDGVGAAAQFNFLFGLALDITDNIYVADTFNHSVRRVTPAGVVSTLAGTGASGFQDGASGTAQFFALRGLKVSPNGDVFVADSANHRIRKISAGQVSTYAGEGTNAFTDGSSQSAQFNFPIGISFVNNDIFVADALNQRLRKISP